MALLDLKDFASRATTGPIPVVEAEPKALKGTVPLVVDGVVPPLAARLLLKDQVATEQNGLYEATQNQSFGGEGTFGGSGNFGEGEGWTLTRTADADSPGEVTRGMLVPVQEGETNAGSSWVQLTEDPIEIGTTDQVFEPITALPVGPAGGHLSGTYADPEVVAGGSNSFT